MAYRISYGPEVPQQYRKPHRPLRLQVMTAAWLLLFVLLVRVFSPAGREILSRCLHPASKSITQQALDGFVADLRQGEAVGDALFAFCESVIQSDPAIAD